MAQTHKIAALLNEIRTNPQPGFRPIEIVEQNLLKCQDCRFMQTRPNSGWTCVNHFRSQCSG